MANNEDLWYVEYNDYNKVKELHDDSIKYNYDEDYLDQTMSTMHNLNPKLNKNDDIIKNLFRLLRNGKVLYAGLNKNYCKHINIWLNKKYMDKDYYSRVPDFNEYFKKFVHQLNHVIYRNQNNSCEKYINYLDAKTITKIDFLHSLYDDYNEIKNTSATNLNEKCSKIVVIDKNYRDNIYDYYVNDKNLFNKVEHIKGLILEKIKNHIPSCVNDIYFSSKKLIEHQQQEKLKAEEEELRKQKEALKAIEEELRNQKEEEEILPHKEQLSKEYAQENQETEHLLSSKGESFLLPQMDALREASLENGVRQSTDDSEDLQTSEVSTFPEHTQIPQYLDMSGSPREKLNAEWTQRTMFLGKDMASPDSSVHPVEDKHHIKGNTGGIFGTIGDSVINVLGDVDPVPVVSVSGGMGALFLLFRYTPVGTFFRGSRRRQRIPNRFYGEYPEFFPGFQGYGDGYFPNDRFNIAYGAE